MTTKEFKKTVVLTTAQFNARQLAGTLEEGVRYEISDYLPVQDATINGTTIVDSNGNAIIPLMQNNVYGVTKITGSAGLRIDSSGNLYIDTANDSEIMTKSGSAPLKPANINKVIQSGLGNYTGTAFSDTEKETARNTIGAGEPYTVTVDI